MASRTVVQARESKAEEKIRVEVSPTIERSYEDRGVFQALRLKYATERIYAGGTTGVFFLPRKDAKAILADAEKQRVNRDLPRGTPKAYTALVQKLRRRLGLSAPRQAVPPAAAPEDDPKRVQLPELSRYTVMKLREGLEGNRDWYVRAIDDRINLDKMPRTAKKFREKLLNLERQAAWACIDGMYGSFKKSPPMGFAFTDPKFGDLFRRLDKAIRKSEIRELPKQRVELERKVAAAEDMAVQAVIIRALTAAKNKDGGQA